MIEREPEARVVYTLQRREMSPQEAVTTSGWRDVKAGMGWGIERRRTPDVPEVGPLRLGSRQAWTRW